MKFGIQNGNTINTVGSATDMARGLLFNNQRANDSALTNTTNQAYDAISSSLMGFTPVGTVIGGAMKVGAFIGDGLQALGGGTDQMTTQDQLMDSSLFSWNIGLLNGFGGKRAQDFSIDRDTIEDVGGSYGGSVKKIENAADKAGKKYGLFSGGARKRANRQIDTARTQQSTMAGIAKEATDRASIAANMSDLNHLQYSFNLNGGYDQRYMRAAKFGTKLQRIKKLNLQSYKVGGAVNGSINLETKEIDWQPTILEPVEQFESGGVLQEWNPTIIEFKQGGKTEELDAPETDETNQKNIIPEGALHARKHHMDNADELTEKGIPVIDEEGQQQAEIERDEIIFTLEVTKKLEELYEKGTDEAAIEAGKLLVKEILFNTEDRTNLITSCEKGGKLDGSQ